ncbi:MAG: hypothetical protein ACJATV_000945 [Granulosicoccus sp.]|jgi:hypothetical protein
MPLSRRTFLRYGATSLLSGCIISSRASSLSAASKSGGDAVFISASSDTLGRYHVTTIDKHYHIIRQHEILSRGHSFAVSHRYQSIFCISRRPENTIEVINFKGELLQRVTLPEQRHLYGHAVCHTDGAYLYTTENKIHDGKGIIGVWKINDTSNKLIPSHTFSSFGVGPHDIHISDDQRYLIVANGGIHTHPNTGRKKLNLSTMSPSLVYIDRETGQLHKQLYLPLNNHKNSIRHLAVSRRATVFIALQNHTTETKNQILLAFYDGKQKSLLPLEIPSELETKLKGYIGSIALDASQKVLAATAPKGNCVLFYTANGEFMYHMNSDDVCGVQSTKNPKEFILTNGKGDMIRCKADAELSTTSVTQHKSIYWDNHLIAL